MNAIAPRHDFTAIAMPPRDASPRGGFLRCIVDTIMRTRQRREERELALRFNQYAACLGSVTRGINVPIDEGLAIEANYFARMVPTRDTEEGLSAWLERRKPRFMGC